MKLRAILPLFFLPLVAAAQTRPPITGISNISVYASDPAASKHFYVDLVGCQPGPDPEDPAGARYYVNPTQFIEVLPLPATAGPGRLDHLGYKTTNAAELKQYLASKGVRVPAKIEKGSDGSRWFRVKDPEGNTVEFVQPPAHPPTVNGSKLAGHHIIHVGMLVRDRAREDTFYKAILDFKPYWYGGMKPDKIDWVSQQTPDSHDWLEYMLTSGPSGSGIPAQMSQRQLGVLNHLSIGVVNMQQTFDMLKAADRLAPPNTHTQVGQDGKWQLNVFDPDQTRLEYMEYGNVRKPCCSDFTSPNPTPDK